MTKKIAFLVMGLLVLGLASAPAQMVFEKTLMELKLGPEQVKAEAEFRFKVVGDKEIEIAEYDAPCSCLEAKISDGGRLRWKPGERGTVKGVFNMGNFRGTVDKMIVLRMKGETVPSVKLTVRLHIPVILKITPDKPLFWDQGGTPDPKTFKLEVTGEDPVKILDMSGTNDQFDLELKTIKDGWNYEIVVTPKTVAERAFGLIRIRTDSKYLKHQRYQCFITIRRPSAPRPKQLPGAGRPLPRRTPTKPMVPPKPPVPPARVP